MDQQRVLSLPAQHRPSLQCRLSISGIRAPRASCISTQEVSSHCNNQYHHPSPHQLAPTLSKSQHALKLLQKWASLPSSGASRSLSRSSTATSKTTASSPPSATRPIYDAPAWPGEATPRIDEGSAFLRTRLGPDGADTRIFLPQRQGTGKSSHAYVAFTYIMVFGQRRLRMPGDLPDVPPAGWAVLREEMLTLVKEGEEGLLTVPGMLVKEEGDDPASMVFVVVTDSREFPFRGPFMREVSFLGSDILFGGCC